MKVFEVLYLAWTGDDWVNSKRIKATDHQEAVEKWAEESDQDGDYDILNSSGLTEFVLVHEIGTVEIKKFKVWADSCPRYFAREVIEK